MAIVKEEKSDDERSVKHSISVPIDFFGLLKSNNVAHSIVSSLGTVSHAEEVFHVPINVYFFELPVGVGEVSICLDCEDILLYENQLSYKSDLET